MVRSSVLVTQSNRESTNVRVERTGVRIRSRQRVLRRQACLCSILKAQKHRFEIPVTDFCDRVRRLAYEGLDPLLFLFLLPSFVRPAADVRSRRRDALIADHSPSRLSLCNACEYAKRALRFPVYDC